MPLQQIVASQANAEVPVNENFQTLEYLSVYAKRPQATLGLVWGYYGGYWQSYTVADGTLTLTASATNYVVVNRSTGAISVSTSNTNWNNVVEYARVYIIVTGTNTVTSVQDRRLDINGIYISYTQNLEQLTDVTTVGKETGSSIVYDSTTSEWGPKFVPNTDSLPADNYSSLVYNTTTEEWQPRIVRKITISNTPPDLPEVNDIWIVI